MEKTKLTLPLLNGHLTQSASAAATASQASTSSANPSRNANPITTTITSSASASNRHLTSEQRKISSVHQGSISSQSYNTDHQGKSPSVLHHHISKSKLCCKCKSSVISSGSSINESVNPSIIDPLISPRPCTVFKVTEWKADFGKSKVTCSLCRQKFIVDHAASHWLSRHATAHQLAVSELQEFMQGRLWAQVDPSRAAARGAPQLLNSSTPQLLNSSTPQLLNSSTPQLLNSSTPQLFHFTMVAVKGQRKHTPSNLYHCLICLRLARKKEEDGGSKRPSSLPLPPVTTLLTKSSLEAHYQERHRSHTYHCALCPELYYTYAKALVSHVRRRHCSGNGEEAVAAFISMRRQIDGHPKRKKLLNDAYYTVNVDAKGAMGGGANGVMLTLSSALTPALLSIAASRDIKLCVRPRSDSDIQTDIIKKEEEVVEPLQQKQTQIKSELESKGQPTEVPQFVIALVETSASPREYLSRFVHNLQVSTAGTAANISSLIAVPIDLPVGSLAQVQASCAAGIRQQSILYFLFVAKQQQQ
ncbi:hypothetical protein TYRP_020249 [Tyrophagus putrescentiae]|nr:hypothetical protein TYRP_020249 [Tyrophagus putrescentiae]